MNNKNEVEQLFNGFMQFRKLVSTRLGQSHEEKMATTLQFFVLNLLQEQSDITIGDLGQILQLSKSSTTQLSERLVKLDLIKRFPDESDRRVIHLVITTKGKKEYNILRKKMITKMNEIFKRIPSQDLKELIRISNNLINSLEQDAI